MEHRAEPARAHELPSVLALLRGADLPETGVAETFRNFVVVRDDEIVVAAAGLEVQGEDGLLRSLVVDPAFRGQGLAGLLVAGAVELASHLKLRALYLLTTTARALFLKHGFADCPREDAPPAIRESWEFRAGCPQSSAFLKRSL
jgi:amino-acid N-acetyltransferase